MTDVSKEPSKTFDRCAPDAAEKKRVIVALELQGLAASMALWVSVALGWKPVVSGRTAVEAETLRCCTVPCGNTELGSRSLL
jgi:hypothetical protein